MAVAALALKDYCEEMKEKFKGPFLLTDEEMAMAERHLAQGEREKVFDIIEESAERFAQEGERENEKRRQAALTGQWKVRQDTEMLLAALAKARQELAKAELAAQRLQLAD